LKTFIEAGNLGNAGAKFTPLGVMWQAIIHVIFIVSAIGIAYVDKLSHHPGHADSADRKKREAGHGVPH